IVNTFSSKEEQMRNNNTTNSLQMVFYSICVIHYKKTTHLYTESIFIVKFGTNPHVSKLILIVFTFN
ncbi:MAG TPA: hypothetical protein VFT71_03365, partial [Candidatus Nitrosocosmicus sp.]|nr:hypothetical protein [Candidatus Nitrosocosmicus sp.]